MVTVVFFVPKSVASYGRSVGGIFQVMSLRCMAFVWSSEGWPKGLVPHLTVAPLLMDVTLLLIALVSSLPCPFFSKTYGHIFFVSKSRVAVIGQVRCVGFPRIGREGIEIVRLSKG